MLRVLNSPLIGRDTPRNCCARKRLRMLVRGIFMLMMRLPVSVSIFKREN